MSNSDKSGHSSDEERESRLKVVLYDLQSRSRSYERIARVGVREDIEHAAVEVAEAMRKVGDLQPDPERQREYHDKAEQFQNAGESGGESVRNAILKDVSFGLLLILSTPFVLAGAVVMSAGGLIYGAGKVATGLGNMLTGGMLDHAYRRRT